ncbi:nucleoside triphosphate pyrophosphohydrolase [Hyphomicrobium sp. CS1BSMeth3]|uniref:nucleoside triphosphate pyrophosphohydrolase n=1 Tax=Hyphomicrobium sp. CS1BSMeth3 TaxID=1892844 RepID=UPI0009308394|nr:nucleoside triphosphate pyrophosphohydrolase [Hyphomicrobium sp. CS1BSMeth3]
MAPPDQPGSRKTIADLIAVMAALRTPGSGCPWDLEQSFETIAPYTIEEAYEVADAIERGNRADLKEELGDLLLQVVYHARMAEEEGAFDFDDVARGVTEKMIRRHPHVFGDEKARSAQLAKGWWENIKAEERAAKQADGNGAAPEPTSLLADVPVGLPGLTRAVKLQAKAARVGFDWPSLAPVFSKMQEELTELEEIAVPADPRGSSPPDGPVDPRIVDEFGDVLFVMANVARHLGIDPETALRTANAKFVRRFAYIEQRLTEQGKTPAAATLEEMDDLWIEAKTKERGG